MILSYTKQVKANQIMPRRFGYLMTPLSRNELMKENSCKFTINKTISKTNTLERIESVCRFRPEAQCQKHRGGWDSFLTV